MDTSPSQEERASLFSWIVENVSTIHDADPHTLAEYIVSTLEGIEQPTSPEGKQALHDALSEVLNEHTESFIDELCTQMDGKSFLLQQKDEGVSHIPQSGDGFHENTNTEKMAGQDNRNDKNAHVTNEASSMPQKRHYRSENGSTDDSYRSQKQSRTYRKDNKSNSTAPLLQGPLFPTPPPTVPFPTPPGMPMMKPMTGAMLSSTYNVPPPIMSMQPSFMGGYTNPHTMYGNTMSPLSSKPLSGANPISSSNASQAQNVADVPKGPERPGSDSSAYPQVPSGNAAAAASSDSSSRQFMHPLHTRAFHDASVHAGRGDTQEPHANAAAAKADSTFRTLRISGLPANECTVPALTQLFTNSSSITSVIVSNSEGYVQFATQNDALAARQQAQPSLGARNVQVTLVSNDAAQPPSAFPPNDHRHARGGAYAGARASRGGLAQDKRSTRPLLAPRPLAKPVVKRVETPLEAATRVLKEKDSDAAIIKDMIEKQKALLEEVKADRAKGIPAAELRKKVGTLKALVQKIKEKQNAVLSAVKTAERAVKSHQEKTAALAKAQQEREASSDQSEEASAQSQGQEGKDMGADTSASVQETSATASAADTSVQDDDSEDEAEFILGDAADY